MSPRQFARYLILSLVALPVTGFLQPRQPERTPPAEEEFVRCALALRGWSSPVMTYSAGFNYELLENLGEETPCTPDIFLTRHDYPLDSLMADSVDMVILPFTDSLVIPETFFSTPVLPDSTVWIIRDSRENLIRTVNVWLGQFQGTKAFSSILQRFKPSYEPFKRVENERIGTPLSPYDELLRQYAKGIGWDWRMLTALVWNESKFHIELRSPRGAEGLMQMMPHTARKHHTDDMLNPEENLRAACEYLQRLQNMFDDDAADPQELMRFTLAAYNAGEGRLQDILNYAAYAGKPHARWSELLEVIPDMREESILQVDTVKLGIFQGFETIKYIEDIEALYQAFCTLAP